MNSLRVNFNHTDFHAWGWVVGLEGFNDFVAISRDRTRVCLLVASDD